VPIEDISRLVGHAGTTVTELVYRHQIRPVVQGGAEVMDTLFGHPGSEAVDAQLDAQGHDQPGNDEPQAGEESP